jgi:hypothetical protein
MSLGLMKPEIPLKEKKIRKQPNAKFNNMIKINNKISLQQFLLLSGAEIQGLLHPAEANLGYFLAWFQSLQLPSTQPGSPLVPKSHVLSCEQNFSFCIFDESSFIDRLCGLVIRVLGY